MRLNYKVRFPYPHSIPLRATRFDLLKTVARNVVEGGYTERHVKLETHLTEPQGNIKNLI